MQKKFKKIIAVLFASILLLASLLLIFNITIIQTPVLTIDIDVIELTSEEAVIKATIEVANPNIFDIVMKDFETLTTTPNGETVSNVLLEGGSISAQSNTTFSTVATLSFHGEIPEVLVTKISSNVGVNIGFIQRTFPFTTTLKTSVTNIMEDVLPPDINIQVEFGEITTEHVGIQGAIDVYNPNTLGAYLEDISITVLNEKGENVGTFAISGAQIPAKSFAKIDMNGSVLLKALNAEKLIFKVSGNAGITIAGGDQNLSVFKAIEITIPKLEEILSLDVASEAVLKSDIRFSLRGVILDLSLEIINPNKIPLVVKDIVFLVYRVDATGETLLGECELGEGIVEPEDSLVLPSQVIISYVKMMFSGRGIFPDELLTKIQAKLSIPGVDQYMLIGVRGYQDLHIFR